MVNVYGARDQDKTSSIPITSSVLGDKNYLDVSTGAVDPVSSAAVTISFEHHEIHEGDHYNIGSFNTLNTGGSTVFGITTPDTSVWAHMTFGVQGTGQTELMIYESGSVSGGTAVTPFNNNRNSISTSDLTIVRNPAVPTAGNVIFTQSIGSGGATPVASPAGGFITRDTEFILKQNTVYIFSMISRTNGNVISYIGEWYEHTSNN